MVSLRLTLLFAAMCTAAALGMDTEPAWKIALDRVCQKVMRLWRIAEHLWSDLTHQQVDGAHQQPDVAQGAGWDKHHHDGHHHWHHHGKIHKMFEEAHHCHHQCGPDAACHAACPKPWVVLAKACDQLPVIKACHEKCDGAKCDECPKFEQEWMNRKFAKHPEKMAHIAKVKCPLVHKIADCHQACKPGDHECHRQCPHFHHGHGHHWHGHHDHDGEQHHHHHEGHDHGHWHHGPWHHHGPMKEMKEAHKCHWKCGSDVACHQKCPKPMLKFVKACQQSAGIFACHAKCKNADCDKCPKFDLDWFNDKYANNPERMAMLAKEKCPAIEKAHACHKACKPGDFDCHHNCPSVFHKRWHQGHHGHHWQKESADKNDVIV